MKKHLLKKQISQKELQIKKLHLHQSSSDICNQLYNTLILEKAILKKEIEEIENANDLVDFIFSSGVEGECEVLDASTNPPIYASVGYIERTDKEEED